MISNTDLPNQPDTLQQSPPMKKKSNPVLIVIFITLFIVELPFTVFLFLALATPFVLLYPVYSPIFLFLAGVNSIILFYVSKRQSQGIAKIINSIALIFTISYGFLSILFCIPFMIAFPRMIPGFISREEAMKQINDCNVNYLTRSSNGIVTRIEFEKGYDVRMYYVTNSDLDTLLGSAQAVQDRCGYDFGDSASGIEGFRRIEHSPYITIDQAAKMLNSCKIAEVVYFSPIEGPYYNYNAPIGEPTGIILWTKEKPRAIYIKKEDLQLKTETLPIVREAKKKCPNLEIHGIHDL